MKRFTIHPTDLTTGSPLRVVALYALPMMVSMLFQQAYNLADGWIAGTQIGNAALGAVGTCYPVTVLFIAIASGLSLGTSLLCSAEYGAKAYGKTKTCILTSYTTFMPLSLLLAGAALASVGGIMRLLAVPEEALQETAVYLRIYVAGLPFLFIYNICNGILNGLGDSRTPLIILIISCVCNVGLDLLLVMVIPMGVAGLALATVLAQGISGIFALWSVRKIYRCLSGESVWWERETLRKILDLGIPSMVQHVLMSVGQLTIQNVINSYGLIVLAGYSVVFRINGIVINTLMALSNAVSGFIAQNCGAGRDDRVREGLRGAMGMAYVYAVLLVAVLLWQGESILGVFIKAGPDKAATIAAGMGFVRVVTPFYLLVCAKIVFDGGLRGIGAMRAYMLVALTDVAVRVGCGQLFSNLWGVNGVWSVWPLAWVCGTALSAGLYRYYRKSLKT